MVTILNENSTQELWSKYQVLFLDAFNALKAAEKLSPSEIEKGTIVSLEQYFNHLGDLMTEDLQDARYIMLPMDEAPFKINGNTRTVTIPNEYVTCGAVKGDMNCEIATFTIDRYFDFQDLANTDIFIQWQNAAGEDGLSTITLFDYTQPGILRFGWPLTNEITSKAGTVKFAVRFCVKNSKGLYDYILNTQPASLIVRDTLEIKEGDEVKKENVGYGAFALFVKNSVNPDVQTAADISFAGVGAKDLEQIAAIDKETNTLKMSVRATSKAPDKVSYSWYFRPEDAIDEPEDTNEKYLLSEGTWYTITAQDFIEVPHEDLRETEEYWIDDDFGAKVKYIYNPAAKESLQDEDRVYKKYSTLTITDTQEDVVGKYWVVVRNSATDNNDREDNYKEATSTPCLVKGPNPVEITSNLQEHVFVGTQSGDKVNLAVAVKAYENEDVKYQWSKATSLSGDYSDISGKTASNLETDENGYYKVTITSTVNRKTTEPKESEVCRVTHHPIAPVLVSQEYNKENAGWTTYSGDAIDAAFGDIVELKVNVTPSTIDNLVSDNLIYKWTVQPLDGTERDITAADVGDNTIIDGKVGDDSALHGNTLRVRCVKNGMAYTYRCQVTNELAGEREILGAKSEDRPAFQIQ